MDAKRKFPKITLVMPSFNQAKYLQKSIESVVNQNYPDLEFIILDGGSTDGSVEIIRSFEQHLTYWRSCSDSGQASAIAEGFRISNGQIMCWLNSDDLLAEGTLEFVGTFFNQNPNIDFIVGEECLIDEQGKILRYLYEPYWNLSWQVYVRNCIPQAAAFWRRSLYQKVEGVNPFYHYGMDYDLWFQFLRYTKPFYIKRLFSFQRIHELTKTSILRDVAAKEMPLIAKKHIQDFQSESYLLKLFWKMHRIITKLIYGSYYRSVLKNLNSGKRFIPEN